MIERNTQLIIPGRHFMTVILGTYPDFTDLRQAILSSKKMSISDGKILERIEISSEEIEIDLWEVSGADLGFTGNVFRGKIYERACNFGFELCSAESIALAHIQCIDVNWRIGGMEPIANSICGEPCVFGFGASNGLWLSTYFAHSGILWHPNCVWIFTRPRYK